MHVFIINCSLNGYVYTLDKLTYDSQNVWKCLTLNKMHIKLASLIICTTNDNLTNTSSTLPPEVKKISTGYSAYNFVYLDRSFHFFENLRIKPLTCFKHQINPRLIFDVIFVVLYDGGAIRK